MDVLVEAYLARYFGLILEAGQDFELVLLVAQPQLVRGVVFLLHEVIRVRQVLVRDFVSEHHPLAELYCRFDFVVVRDGLHVEETILKILRAFATATEENVVACVTWHLRMNDLLVR